MLVITGHTNACDNWSHHFICSESYSDCKHHDPKPGQVSTTKLTSSKVSQEETQLSALMNVISHNCYTRLPAFIE